MDRHWALGGPCGAVFLCSLTVRSLRQCAAFWGDRSGVFEVIFCRGGGWVVLCEVDVVDVMDDCGRNFVVTTGGVGWWWLVVDGLVQHGQSPRKR